MLTISDLEQRITAAFDRMDRGLDTLTRAHAQLGLPTHDIPAEDTAPKDESAADVALDTVQDSPPAHLALLLQSLQQAKAANVVWAERYSALEAEYSAQTLAMAAEIARLAQDAPPSAAESASEYLGAPPDSPDLQAKMASRDAEIDELTARIALQEAELETLRAQVLADTREIGDLVTALAPLVTQSEVPHV